MRAELERMRRAGQGPGARDARRDRARAALAAGRDRPLRRLRRRRDRPGGPGASRSRSPSSAPGRGARRAAGPIHDQVPGGRRRRPAARLRAPQPRGRAGAPAARAARPGGRPGRAGAAEARRRRGVDPRRGRSRRSTGLPELGGDAEPDVRPSQAFVRTLQRAEKEMAGARRRVHLHRAPPARPGRQVLRGRRPPARPRLAAEGDLGGPRAAPRHLARTPRTRCRRWRSSAATSPPRPSRASSTR